MPQQVALVKGAAGIIHGVYIPVFIQITNVNELIGRKAYPPPGNRLLHFLTHQWPEPTAERKMMRIFHRCRIPENTDGMTIHAHDKFVAKRIVHRRGKIDIFRLGGKGLMQLCKPDHRHPVTW
jgi:hypothetical protein